MQNIQPPNSLQSLPRKALFTLASTADVFGPAQNAVSTNPAASRTTRALERGDCYFPESKRIRYGLTGRHVYKTLDGPVKCTDWVFGDLTLG